MYRVAGGYQPANWPCISGSSTCSGNTAKFYGSMFVNVAGRTLYSGLASGTYGNVNYLWLAEVGKGAIRQITLDGALRALH